MSYLAQGSGVPVSSISIYTSDGRGYTSQVAPWGEVVMAFDCEEGWKKSALGIEALTTDELERLLNTRAREFQEIFGKIDSIKAQALGRQQFADRECEVVLLSGERLHDVLLFLDPETCLPVGMRAQNRKADGPLEETRIWDDIRSVGPVKMAHSAELFYGGELFVKAIVTSIAINKGVDETRFARPD
jgi:hypothetical protein